jgi:hypothetical protein
VKLFKGKREEDTVCDWISHDFAPVQMGKKKKKETGASLNVCPVLSKTLFGDCHGNGVY